MLRGLIRVAGAALVLIVVLAAAARPADAAGVGPLAWTGPLLPSVDDGGAQFAADDNAVDLGSESQPWSCADGICLISDGQHVYGSEDPLSGSFSQVHVPGAAGDRGLPVTSPILGSDLPDGFACASTGFCLATYDVGGELWVSTSSRPVTGAWSTPVRLAADTRDTAAASCPSAGLCLILTGSGTLWSSATPAVPTSWQRTQLFSPSAGTTGDPGISCAAATLCFASDSTAHSLVSTDPAGGVGAWQTAASSVSASTGHPACLGTSFCVASDGTGRIYGSSTPTDASSWHQVFYDTAKYATPNDDIELSCTGDGACIGFDGQGYLLSSDDPLGGPGAWTVSPSAIATGSTDEASQIQPVCMTDGCMAHLAGVDSTAPSGVLTTDVPLDPRAWHPHLISNLAAAFGQVSCPTTTLCVAADANGELQMTRAPVADVQWTRVHVAARIAGLDCPSATLCLGQTAAGRLYGSRTPAAADRGWTAVPGAQRPIAFTCVGSGYCLGVDRDGRVWSSRHPTAAWHPGALLSGWVAGTARHRAVATVACGDRAHCLVAEGRLIWALGGARRAPVRLTRSPGQLSISCPSTRLCLGVSAGDTNAHGVRVGSANPWAARPAWELAPGPDGVIHCDPHDRCVELRQNSGHVANDVDAAITTVWLNAHADLSTGGWQQELWSGVLSDAPPYPGGFHDVSGLWGRLWVVVGDTGTVFTATPGHGCRILDDGIFGCG